MEKMDREASKRPTGTLIQLREVMMRQTRSTSNDTKKNIQAQLHFATTYTKSPKRMWKYALVQK